MQHAVRMNALAGSIESPLLVTRLPNIRYLTGFSGSSAYLLAVPGGGGTFLTDGRYGEAAEPLVGALDGVDLMVSTGPLWEAMARMLEGLDTLALEEAGVTWEFVRTLRTKTGIDPTPTSGAVESLRRIKDPAEVEALTAAARAGDRAFSALPRLIEEAPVENDLGWALTSEMRRHGGDPADWDPIVAIGAGASIPHYHSADVPIETGMLLLDYGCIVEGYHSDMSRTVWLGPEPDPELSRVYRAVAESQQAGIDAVAPGVACGAVDEAVREVLRGYGYEDQFLHSTGHGVGLEIHEEPWVRRGNDDLLQVGNVVTVEPGVYLAGKGGVRIEDMVLVTEDGPVMLTESSREMMPA
ncbi:MAG: aminopeptidase P family protein [Actinobacteria bacterium]|nr:aminopeptidase P family protein [Actinomycetota bacterium]MBU1495022.1 aminopeptidase P family protein [Actinomycetota bacterium]